jgi:hypothetical protein
LNKVFTAEYDVPYVNTQLIDINGQQANEILNVAGNKMSIIDKMFKMKVSSMFELWMPDYLAKYNILRDRLSGMIDKINQEHIFQFSDTWFFPSKKSVVYRLKTN